MKKLLPCLTLGLCLSSLLSSCATDPNAADYQQARNNFEQQNYQLAFQQIQGPAQQGNNPDAEYALGYMYYYGKGTPTDQVQGKTWIIKAAKDGSKEAQDALKIIVNQEQSMGNPETSAVTTPAQEAPQDAVVAPVAVAASPAVSAVEATAPTEKANATTPDGFTMQLFVSSSRSTAEDFITKHQLMGRATVAVRNVNAKTDYVVTLGYYTTRTEANKALHQLPKNLQELHPWIRPN